MSKTDYWEYVKSLPKYLGAFAVDQNYENYTPENQATWRFIMRQLTKYLEENAHEVYLQGLKQSSIQVDRIPKLEEMIDKLSELGWGAIAVEGFIPPAAFMEYNAHKVLPISSDMRTLNHLLYTPAPDIVHEAAGHAPIIVDKEYSKFLQKVGQYGAKALSNQYDQKVYEAIRKLSIVKEHPNSSDEEIELAQKELDDATTERDQHPVSEAGLISRFHWWTVEYGLIGKPNDLKIYGAGLLSSLGESKSCLSEEVKKVPLTIDCLKYHYDITSKQPQLFYVESWHDLDVVLEEIADQMAFRLGGVKGMQEAIRCGCLATARLSSKLDISGHFADVKIKDGKVIYIRSQGPSSLSYQGKELSGHGQDYHEHGYSTPVGKIKGLEKDLENCSREDLEKMGIKIGEDVFFEFESGISVRGYFEKELRSDDSLLLLTFTSCTVKDSDGQVLFQPEWGVFDMGVGSGPITVFGGPGDKSNYDFISQKSQYNMNIDYSDKDKEIFDIYRKVRKVREDNSLNPDIAMSLFSEIKGKAENNWLLFMELYELVIGNSEYREIEQKIAKEFDRLSSSNDEYKHLINLGKTLIS